MIMSRQAGRLAGDVGTVVPDASRHQLFTAGGRRREPAEHRLPWPPAAARPVACRRCAAFLPCQPRQAAGQPKRAGWEEPRDDSPDLHHRAG